MSRQRPSIEDIARAAGVANSTVSRALHDSSLISAEVREHIQRLAGEMGYTPNGIAQSLQTKRTNTIGLVVTSIADPFFVDIVKGVEEVARPAKLSIFLSASYNDPEQEWEVIETFQRRRVDGIINASSRIGNRSMKQLANVNLPTVLINHDAEAQYELLHSVSVDDYLGAHMAVDHLLQLGHRAVGYAGLSNRPRSNRRRLEGYRDALASAGVPYRDTWVAIAPAADRLHEDDVVAGQALLLPLLAAKVTAIFCYNDLTAIGVLMACHKLGIAVPQELSMIGFDNIAPVQYVTPPLTTIDQPKVRLGRLAMQMVLDLLAGRAVQNVVLPPVLVTRASTAEP